MAGFEITEHTADVGVAATGDTFAEALAWLARGMFSVIAALEGVETRESIEVSVSSIDREALVIDWLNELLYRYDGEGWLLKEFDVVVSEDGRSLTARCKGEHVAPERHELLGDIKAATYHGLEVSHNPVMSQPDLGEWRISVVLDV